MSEFFQQHMTPSQIITDIMAICMLFGAFDYFRGNPWGLGAKFEEAFSAFVSLTINMVGIICFMPLVQAYVVPWITPLFSYIGVDPGMIAGLILANDTGGFHLSQAMASDPNAANLGGMLLGSMFGVNIVFNIPVALGIIQKEDRIALAKGMACGFITLPFGCVIGGLAAGYSFLWTVVNLIPAFVVAVIIAALLILIPEVITRIFIVVGRGVMAVALIGTVAGIFAAITGITLISGMSPVSEGFDIVVSIIMILPGAYVSVELLTRFLTKKLAVLRKGAADNSRCIVGLVTVAANAIPAFSMIKDMDMRGKIVTFSFIVSSGYLLGDHLAFCTAVSKAFVLPLLIGKLSAGLLAVCLALFLTKTKRKD